MGFFVVGSRTSRFGGSIFLPVTDIHAGAGKAVDGYKDSAIWKVAKTTADTGNKGRTVTKTAQCGQLQRQPQYGLRSVDGSKDNRLSVAMTTAMGT